MIADGKPDEAWQTALKHQAHLVELLLSVRASSGSASFARRR